MYPDVDWGDWEYGPSKPAEKLPCPLGYYGIGECKCGKHREKTRFITADPFGYLQEPKEHGTTRPRR
jgi:hypothetical protein